MIKPFSLFHAFFVPEIKVENFVYMYSLVALIQSDPFQNFVL